MKNKSVENARGANTPSSTQKLEQSRPGVHFLQTGFALVALLSLTGCVQWWVATSDSPSPEQTSTVMVQPISGQVVAFAPVAAPSVVAATAHR